MLIEPFSGNWKVTIQALLSDRVRLVRLLRNTTTCDSTRRPEFKTSARGVRGPTEELE